jgi:hypothetical protein
MMVRIITLFGMLLLCESAALARPNSRNARPDISIKDGEPMVAARIGMAYGVITSIHRSPAHNRMVGGMPNSYHLRGRAIDIARRPGVSHSQIATVLRAAGYNLIESLDEGDHSHFAFGPAAYPPGSRAQKATVLTTKAQPAAVQDKVAAPLPAVKLVEADSHGTLLLDLVAGQQSQASAVKRPGTDMRASESPAGGVHLSRGKQDH